jgi:hypothetical protein
MKRLPSVALLAVGFLVLKSDTIINLPRLMSFCEMGSIKSVFDTVEPHDAMPSYLWTR